MRVRKSAMELENIALLVKLAPVNMNALEAQYHLEFLLKIQNRTRVAIAIVAVDNFDLHPKTLHSQSWFHT